MNTIYRIYIIHEDRDQWASNLKQAIHTKLSNLGIEENENKVKVKFLYDNLSGTTKVVYPSIAVYLGSIDGSRSERCINSIRTALNLGICIIPVIEDGISFKQQVPTELYPINAFKWSGISPAERLAWERILPELGLTEKERKVFISYRRSDGLGMADQLFDALSRRGFTVFMDLYDIESGRDVQMEITEYLEDIAFVLVIESPEAHYSKWIYKEMNYALKHHMGLRIIHWPLATQIPNTNDLPRRNLTNNEMISDVKYIKISDSILSGLINEIEFWHADGLLRRRRYLLESIEKEARIHYSTCLNIGNWTLFLRNGMNKKENTVIGITPRLPNAYDLYYLDNPSLQLNNISQTRKLLVHLTEYIPQERSELLEWIIDNRLMKMIPLEHFIGGGIL